MTDDLIWSANRVRELLQRIHGYLDEEEAAKPPLGHQTYHPRHPTTMLAEAEDVIEDLALRAGLWPPPRTVRKTDWDKVEATTEEEIERQIKEDGTEPESMFPDWSPEKHVEAAAHPSITCPKCGLTSYNLNDIKHRFCARCGFHQDFEPG